MTLSFRLSALPLSWPDILPQPWPTTGATGITSWVPESCRLLASRKILSSEQFLPWLTSSSRQTTILQSCFVYTFLSSFQFPTLLDYRTIGNHLEWSHLLATLYDPTGKKKKKPCGKITLVIQTFSLQRGNSKAPCSSLPSSSLAVTPLVSTELVVFDTKGWTEGRGKTIILLLFFRFC